MDIEFTAFGIALIPVILGVIEVFKRVGLNSKFSPVLALILGLIAGWFVVAPGEPAKAVLSGIVMALSAIGLWSGPKNTAEGLRGEEDL